MRKNLVLSMLAASAILASCSNDDAVENNGLLNNGEGYVRLAINLPSVSGGTRADNDVFDDGTANEYAVSDATLILFQGASESAATLTTAYNLNLSFNMDDPSNDNITNHAEIVQKINATLASGDKLYALVVLNNNNQLVVDASHKLEVNGTDVTGKTLAKFITDTEIDVTAKKLVDGNGATATQFFMANAPLNTVAGGSADPSSGTVKTLAEIDQEKVYSTQALAASNPATVVNVERAVAKVTLSDGITGDHKTTTNSLEFEIVGWQLDNTNTESYLIRNVDGFTTNWAALKSNMTSLANPYRFVGSNAVTSGLYRTYWGLDPNYATTDGTGMKYWDEDDTDAPTYSALGSANPLYCAENTFDVEHQKDINTTAAIVKARFKVGGEYDKTFYTINNSSSELYLEGNGTNGINKAIKSYFMSNTNIRAKLTPLLSRTLTESDLTVTYSSATDVAGVTLVADIKIDGDALTGGLDKMASTIYVSGTTTAVDVVNATNVIRRYVNGIAYYAVQIKHFGDELTPWNTWESTKPTSTNIYPGNSAADYLGRYGVLRNNWYDVEVTKIKNLGSATVPTLGTTPTTPPDDPDIPGDGGHDDDIDQYISVRINILSWAKRVQSIEL